VIEGKMGYPMDRSGDCYPVLHAGKTEIPGQSMAGDAIVDVS